ncbi:threonine aldolase family protein [Variovorax beijingensis]|uniref:threonine aldolase family protein n=1 Tax=Variovorax beijingensis TaxID=2496117 RepID=UPI003F697940
MPDKILHVADSGLPRSPCKAGAVVDLRSDTVTLPTPSMYGRMQTAVLGDDGLDGDPTVRALEALVARTLGKEAGLYVPTATMGNLLAVLSQADRRSQVVLEESAHMFVSERGGAVFSGVTYTGIPGVAGAMDLESLALVLKSSSELRTDLVCMETTHGNAGGAVLPLDHMRAVWKASSDAGVRVHLDGARLFNAAVALNVDPAAIACYADTVALCLSKGLSAPAGAVLAGPSATMASARRLRKMLGGTQRQIGVVAAAGLDALETMPGRLAQDHASASRLSEALRAALPGAVSVSTPPTNIVFVDLPEAAPDSLAWVEALKECGVLVRPWGPRRIRLVTHRHIDATCVDAAATGFGRAAQSLLA